MKHTSSKVWPTRMSTSWLSTMATSTRLAQPLWSMIGSPIHPKTFWQRISVSLRIDFSSEWNLIRLYTRGRSFRLQQCAEPKSLHLEGQREHRKASVSVRKAQWECLILVSSLATATKNGSRRWWNHLNRRLTKLSGRKNHCCGRCHSESRSPSGATLASKRIDSVSCKL